MPEPSQDEMLKEIKTNLGQLEADGKANARLEKSYDDYSKSQMSAAAKKFREDSMKAIDDLDDAKVAPAEKDRLKTQCGVACDNMDAKLQTEYKSLITNQVTDWKRHEDKSWKPIFDAAKNEIKAAIDATGPLTPDEKKDFLDDQSARLSQVKTSNQAELKSLHRSTKTQVESNQLITAGLLNAEAEKYKPSEVFKPIGAKEPEDPNIASMAPTPTLLVERLKRLQDSKEETYISEKFPGHTYDVKNNSVTMNGPGEGDNTRDEPIWNWDEKNYKKGIRGMIHLAAQKIGVKPGDEIVISYANTNGFKDEKSLKLILWALQEAQEGGYYAKLDSKMHVRLEELKLQELKKIEESLPKSMKARMGMDTDTDILKVIKQINALEEEMRHEVTMKKMAQENSKTMTENADKALGELKQHEAERSALDSTVQNHMTPPIASSAPGAAPAVAAAADEKEAVARLEAKDVITDANYLRAAANDTAAKLPVLETLVNEIEARRKAAQANEALITAQMLKLPELGLKAEELDAHQKQLKDFSEQNKLELLDLERRGEVCRKEIANVVVDPASPTSIADNAKKAELTTKLEESTKVLNELQSPSSIQSQDREKAEKAFDEHVTTVTSQAQAAPSA